MDLDKLKDAWKNADIKGSINEDTIQHILNNKGKRAFSYLLRYEEIASIISISCAIPIIMLMLLKPSIVPLYLLISIIFITIWQRYKVHFLKNIDILGMSILEVSHKINTYKKYIAREWILGIAWTLSICVLFLYDDINFLYKIEDPTLLQLILKGLIIFAFILGLAYLVFKLTFGKNMKKLEEAINEEKEFDKGNI